MHLEYLATGSTDCPLIRLYDFTADEVRSLHAAIMSLATGSAREVSVTELPGVTSIGGCRLILRTDRRDRGVHFRDQSADFECAFTETAWNNVAGLVEPFIHNRSGYQWLAEGDANLLISGNGQW